MKAIDIYKTGLIMSGLDGNEEFIVCETNGADQLFFINKVLLDLRIPTIGSIEDELDVNMYTVDAISSGIAYYLSLRASDRDRTAFLCDLYNAKRASAMSSIARIKFGCFFKN